MDGHAGQGRLRGAAFMLLCAYLVLRPFVAAELPAHPRPALPAAARRAIVGAQSAEKPLSSSATPSPSLHESAPQARVSAPPAPFSNSITFLSAVPAVSEEHRAAAAPRPTDNVLSFAPLKPPPAREASSRGAQKLERHPAIRPAPSTPPDEPRAPGSAWLELLLIGASTIMLLLSQPDRSESLRRLHIPLIAWLMIITIQSALRGLNAQAQQDLVALAGGPLLLCASACSWERWHERLLVGLLAGAALMSGFALWQYVMILPTLAASSAGAAMGSLQAQLYEVAARGRVLGTFSLPILFAAYLLLVIPLAIGELARRRGQPWPIRAACWIIVLLTVDAWVLTRALGALIALVAACVMVWRQRRVNARGWLCGGAGLLLCGGLVLSARADLWHYRNPHHPIHNRLVYWDAALHLITTHPLIGIGPGRFGEQYRDVTAAPQAGTRHAHNTYLQIWAEWGLFALLAWCWLLGAILRRTATVSPWLALALWALPIANLFDFSFYTAQVCMLWWYLAGWSFRVRQQRRRADSA